MKLHTWKITGTLILQSYLIFYVRSFLLSGVDQKSILLRPQLDGIFRVTLMCFKVKLFGTILFQIQKTEELIIFSMRICKNISSTVLNINHEQNFIFLD